MLRETEKINPIWLAVSVFLIASVFFFGHGYIAGLSKGRSEGEIVIREVTDICKKAMDEIGADCVKSINSINSAWSQNHDE